MLKLKIKEAILSKGHVYPHAWLKKKAGFGQTKAFNLLNNKQQSLTMVDLTRLCLLLECTPNDLIYWSESPHRVRNINQPCTMLSNEPLHRLDWLTLLPKLKKDEIDSVRNDILNRINP